MQTFFTSDPHYGHKNIVKALSNWTDKDGCRDFPSLMEMNDALVAGINSVVGAHDTLYCLGDWNFGGLRNLHEFRQRVTCQNVHLILGNHDFKHGTVDPSTVDHGFTSVSPLKEITVNGQYIVLCHYALRVWNHQNKGAWHLYGHSHGTLSALGNFSMDVGVDRVDGFDPVPYTFDQIKELFKHDGIAKLDHHA